MIKLPLEKKVYLCTECALAYYKQIWEPMWLAKIMWKRTHEIEHTQERITNVSMDYQNGLQDGQDQERERIIEIIESRSRATSLEKLIALIKGETHA